MVYRRRYFPALTITTISYAPKSITAEKIADGAVIHPKVAPDAIDSERVIDESLRSVDIKDGEIKTPDLQDGAVTTPKIATAAVTPEKLSVSVLTRPISPGVNTAELLDANVTLAKLAPNSVNASKIVAGGVDAAALAADAVETAKIKDAQITLPKMAPDSIDNTVIKANTIRGTEIGPGACGESEIGTDAIVTVKVKDRNITSPKIALDGVITENIIDDAITDPKLYVAALARRHIESFLVRTNKFFEEFGGVDISNKWAKAGAAGGSVLPEEGRGIRIKTGAVNGNDQRIDWGQNLEIRPLTFEPIMNVLILNRKAPVTFFTNNIGLWKDANNHIVFYAHDAAGATPNWFAKCVEGGAPTSTDTGIAVTSAQQQLSIEYLSDIAVKFYIDGVLKATIGTNIPSAIFTEPRLEIITRGAFDQYMDIKDFILLGTK